MNALAASCMQQIIYMYMCVPFSVRIFCFTPRTVILRRPGQRVSSKKIKSLLLHDAG